MRTPSIVRELGWIVGLGALLMAAAVALAAVLAVDEEVHELLDDALQSSAELLAPLVLSDVASNSDSLATAVAMKNAQRRGNGRFAWALLNPQGKVMRHGGAADFLQQLPPAPRAGLAAVEHWRIYGQALGPNGNLLLVAQSHEERREVEQEVGIAAALTGLGVACVGLPLLLARTRGGLRPLESLSEQLARMDLNETPHSPALELGPAQRRELEPIHTALQALGERWTQRLQFERAFAAQAAHLLRTPLAGIDAQLAIALKEQPGQPRLQQVRAATTRLQKLVLALLRLFRSTPEINRQRLDVRAMLADLPIAPLTILPGPPLVLVADAELVAAALLNLLDNAQRHGGHRVSLHASGINGMIVSDDGPGVSDADRHAIQAALSGQAGATQRDQDHRLGLRLADLVARAHGGGLSLPALGPGFHVQLEFGAPD